MSRFASSSRRDLMIVACILALGAAVITFTQNSYNLLILTLVPIWGIMGLSWNILGGYLGLVSFGQAAFFGLGAFTVAVLAHDYDVTPWIGLPLAGVIGAISALIIGVITFRFRGFYFALAILSFPLALLNIFEWAGWSEVAIPMHRENAWTFMQFDDPRIFAYIAFVAFCAALALSLGIERSRFGLSLFALRQDEIASRVAGIPAFTNKLKAIAISGVFAALAGGIYALVLFVITPISVFGMLVSAQALIVSMFGGRGSAWGAAIGAAILVPLSEWLHGEFGVALPGIAGFVYGLAIILVVLLLPSGIFWSLFDKFSGGSSVSTENDSAETPAEDDVFPELQAPEIGDTLLDVSNISVAFGGVQALDKVTFSVAENEILGIIGPNGAGKTTLFNVLSGLVRAQAGEATIAGSIALVGKSAEEICINGVGRTFQTVRVFRRLTLLENVVVGALVKFKSNAEALEQAQSVLSRVGLSGQAEKTGSALNNRELRLMELARALAADPQIVLLDECLAGLSADDISHIIGVLRRLRADGLTIIIIEHTIEAISKLTDRLVVMDHGTVLVSGEPSEVLKNPDVISAYLGKRWAQNAEN